MEIIEKYLLKLTFSEKLFFCQRVSYWVRTLINSAKSCDVKVGRGSSFFNGLFILKRNIGAHFAES